MKPKTLNDYGWTNNLEIRDCDCLGIRIKRKCTLDDHLAVEYGRCIGVIEIKDRIETSK